MTKRFGAGAPAVDSADLEIMDGELFALLGPSGCGKTTLLRMIAGFETPTSGDIRLDGADVAGVPPNRRPVNMVFQSYAVFPHMSVFDNVAYGLKVTGVAAASAGRGCGTPSPWFAWTDWPRGSPTSSPADSASGSPSPAPW